MHAFLFLTAFSIFSCHFSENDNHRNESPPVEVLESMPIDLLLCSDTLYDEKMFPLFLKALTELATVEHTKILISYKKRYERYTKMIQTVIIPIWYTVTRHFYFIFLFVMSILTAVDYSPVNFILMRQRTLLLYLVLCSCSREIPFFKALIAAGYSLRVLSSTHLPPCFAVRKLIVFNLK